MDDLRKAILRGHKSEVEKLLTNIVIDELIDFKNDSSGYITTAGILSDYAKLAEKLGVTIPEGLGAFNTRDDIRGIV